MAHAVCESLRPFLAMDILEKAAEMEHAGIHIIHLEIGQPDFTTPECVNEAAIAAVRDGKTTYTHSLGILPLREGIAEYYDAHYHVPVSPEQIVVTNGTSPAMMAFFSLFLNPGDSVITPTPTYACYDSMVRFAGGVSTLVPAAEEEDFQFSPKAVKKALLPNTTAILFNSPSNPAGTLISRQNMQALAELGPMLVSDEIYHGLVYEGEAVSALELTPNCCLLDGFSKRYAMTGWRLGWMVLPKTMVHSMQILMQNFFISTNSISQWAGLAALQYAWPDVERMRDEYNRRRIVMLEGLRALGFGIRSHPIGAFYVLADARHLTPAGQKHNSLALAFDILQKAHVGVAPGIDFGDQAEGYLRFSYANSVENIQEALHHLRIYLEMQE